MEQYTEINKALSEIKERTASVEKKVDEMAQRLPKTQQNDMKVLLQRAYNDKVFSVNHTSKVDTMTREQTTDLLISYVSRTSK